ncbi:hypothetical protein LXL04_035420 [Taraxacum kok-saghyz]
MVSYDGGLFSVGDDVYVKRREDASSDDDDPEVEECRVCFKAGRLIMIECDDCLGHFHLKCLKPPLRSVPDGDWICTYCEAKKSRKKLELPSLLKGKRRRRTAKEMLLSSDLWAVRIQSLWKDVDGSFWFRGQWYIIPEETSAGRQPHNLKRELYRTNDFADNEMETVLRHCYVMPPNEYAKASNEGDDVFLCEYEYDVKWHSFKRILETDNNEEDEEEAEHDDDWSGDEDSDSETNDDMEYKKEDTYKSTSTHKMAAVRRCIFGLGKIGTKIIPEHVRCHKQTELEKAKATLLLATLPKSLPCRNKEMEEITTFIKGTIQSTEICRRAAELADYRVKNSISIPKDISITSPRKCLVGMGEVEAAIQEMFQAPHIQVMRSCSKLSKVFLAAMVHEFYKTGMSETTFEKLAQIVSSLCTSNEITFPGWDTLLRIGCKLGESRIILCESGASHRFQKLQLNFPSDDVSFALKDSKELPWLTKYIHKKESQKAVEVDSKLYHHVKKPVVGRCQSPIRNAPSPC